MAVARRAAAAAAADGAALRRDPLRWYTIRTPGALLNSSDGALYLTYRRIHSRIHFYSVLLKIHGNFKQKTRQITPFTSCPNSSNSFYRSVWFLRLTIVFSTSILGSKGNGRRRGGWLLGTARSQDAAAAATAAGGAPLQRSVHARQQTARPTECCVDSWVYVL